MTLPRSTPSAQGLDASGIGAALDAMAERGVEVHSLMVARHGHVVAQGWAAPYAADRVHLLYSLSKSFTASAVGALVDTGELDLDTPVVEHFPWVDEATLDPVWHRVTLRHCLLMRTGHLEDAWTGMGEHARPTDPEVDPVVLAILARVPEAEPGTVFTYNQDATYLAAAAVRAVTGGSLLDVLRPRILDPLGIGEVLWHRTREGHELGFSGLHGRTEDVLALGQTYLDRGWFGGRPVLSEDFVAQARPEPAEPSPGAEAPDWERGYGLSFWGNRYGFRGDGAFGQFMVVLPDHEVVVAMTGECAQMQDVLDALWAHLVPAIGGGSPAADADLQARLDAWVTPTPEAGERHTGGQWSLVDGPWAGGTAWLDDDGRLHLDAGATMVTCAPGAGTWVESTWERDGRVLPVAAAGGWASDGTYAADLRVVETPHLLQLRTAADGTASLTWRLEPLNGPDPFSLAVRRTR